MIDARNMTDAQKAALVEQAYMTASLHLAMTMDPEQAKAMEVILAITKTALEGAKQQIADLRSELDEDARVFNLLRRQRDEAEARAEAAEARVTELEEYWSTDQPGGDDEDLEGVIEATREEQVA
jgi:septal ring factor EnvC (AmiA/AmiB activator)